MAGRRGRDAGAGQKIRRLRVGQAVRTVGHTREELRAAELLLVQGQNGLTGPGERERELERGLTQLEHTVAATKLHRSGVQPVENSA